MYDLILLEKRKNRSDPARHRKCYICYNRYSPPQLGLGHAVHQKPAGMSTEEDFLMLHRQTAVARNTAH